MKNLYLNYISVFLLCVFTFSCTKKEPSDWLSRKSGKWNYSWARSIISPDNEPNIEIGNFVFNENGTGVQSTDTSSKDIKWEATNFTVMIEHYPQQYTYYKILESSKNRLVIQNSFYFSSLQVYFFNTITLTR